jgi:hypothetical protein
MTKLIETPYDDDVRELAQEFGLSLDQTRDRFILAALRMGEAGPLICFLLRGYVPGLPVRHHIALIMADEEGLPEGLRNTLNYHFDIKSRSGRRGPQRGKFETNLRRRKHGKLVKALMEKFGPGSYLAAIKQVAGESGLSEQTIRDAYDQGKRSSK